MRSSLPEPTSLARHVPGVLTLHAPRSAWSPVVFDSPHSGTCYPKDFGYAIDPLVLRRGEDTFVDELYACVPDHGAFLLEAHFPRVYIDPNRPEDDIDEALLDAPWPGPTVPSVKSLAGIGLIWRVVCEGMPIYDRHLSVAEVSRRIATCFRPYHAALDEAVAATRRRFGAVWHVNCHSMPSRGDNRSPGGGARLRPDFCLGDRDGTTADAEFVHFVRGTLRALGYRVTVNDPYKGVELVRRHGRPSSRMNSLQIEINQRLFIDEASRAKTSEFEALKTDVGRLAKAICAYAMDHAPRP